VPAPPGVEPAAAGGSSLSSRMQFHSQTLARRPDERWQAAC